MHRVPINSNTNTIMCLQNPQCILIFPIPEEHSTFCVSWSKELAIRWKCCFNCISCTLMSLKFLFPVKTESPSLRIVYRNLIICWLHCTVLLRGVHRCWGYWMHFWLCYMCQNRGDSKLPYEYLLIICSWNKLSTIINKGNGINRPQVLAILLYLSPQP